MIGETISSSLHITILADNPESWIGTYVQELKKQLLKRSHIVSEAARYEDITAGDIAFFLGCEHIVPREHLALNSHNLVVHESDLPRGKGWSPLTWQILEGKNQIPNRLFEVVEELDAGVIYFQETMSFEGHELIDEMRAVQGRTTVRLCLQFVDTYPDVVGRPQQGPETIYERRKPGNSEVDPSLPITDLFNQFRAADNAKYPVYFHHKGNKYYLKIQ